MTAAAGQEGRGRKRLVAGWTLLLAGVILAAACVRSAWHEEKVGGARWIVTLTSGVVTVRHYGEKTPVGNGQSARDEEVNTMVRELLIEAEAINLSRDRFRWWWWQWNMGPMSYAAAPFWPLPAAMLGAGAVLAVWARRVRVRDGCGRCGYDLRGLGAATLCPECGKSGAT